MRLRAFGLLTAGLLVGPLPAEAVSVTYTVANEGGSTWLYSYTLDNDSLATGISEFRIFFKLGDFEDLVVAGSATNWDPVTAQPDPGLPDDGYVDWLALGAPLAFGDSLFGFQVRFTWLGAGSPGAQSFSVLDPDTFVSLFDGRTSLAGGVPPPIGVPEPGTLGLFAMALSGLAIAARRRRVVA